MKRKYSGLIERFPRGAARGDFERNDGLAIRLGAGDFDRDPVSRH